MTICSLVVFCRLNTTINQESLFFSWMTFIVISTYCIVYWEWRRSFLNLSSSRLFKFKASFADWIVPCYCCECTAVQFGLGAHLKQVMFWTAGKNEELDVVAGNRGVQYKHIHKRRIIIIQMLCNSLGSLSIHSYVFSHFLCTVNFYNNFVCSVCFLCVLFFWWWCSLSFIHTVTL